jgi:hypothetical protein
VLTWQHEHVGRVAACEPRVVLLTGKHDAVFKPTRIDQRTQSSARGGVAIDTAGACQAPVPFRNGGKRFDQAIVTLSWNNGRHAEERDIPRPGSFRCRCAIGARFGDLDAFGGHVVS